MRGSRIAALVAALIVVLCAGIWLGGHPAKLPEFLRDRFVDDTAGLNLEATELIEDNYYRPVGPAELTNASLQGMVRELRRRHGDRFSDYFSPEALAAFDAAISETSLRGRADRLPGEAGVARRRRLSRLAGAAGGDRAG